MEKKEEMITLLLVADIGGMLELMVVEMVLNMIPIVSKNWVDKIKI